MWIWSFRHPFCLLYTQKPIWRMKSSRTGQAKLKDRQFGIEMDPYYIICVLDLASRKPAIFLKFLFIIYRSYRWIAFTYNQMFWFNVTKLINFPQISKLERGFPSFCEWNHNCPYHSGSRVQKHLFIQSATKYHYSIFLHLFLLSLPITFSPL